MCGEKGKDGKKDIYLMVPFCADVFQIQGFVWIQKYFIKIILVGEIMITDNFFCFCWKSSSRLVDVVM